MKFVGTIDRFTRIAAREINAKKKRLAKRNSKQCIVQMYVKWISLGIRVSTRNNN